MVKDNRQGYVLVAVMVIIWLAAVGGISFFETHTHAGIATAAGGHGAGGYGDAVRHARLLAVRGVHHGDLHRRGELLP